MSNNQNEVQNFEQLMRKYLKDNEQIVQRYEYQIPLKEISPLDPLLFQNDIFSKNKYPNNIPNFEPIYNNAINKNIPNISNQRNNLIDNINSNNSNDNKFITPSKSNNKNISNINSFINSSIEREKLAKEEKKKKQLEYQKMLDEQIKEKKLRQEKEKEKRLQEDLKFEEKLRFEHENYQQEINKIKNKNKYRNISNLFSEEEQKENKNPISSNNIVIENNNINNNINNNLNIEKEIEETAQKEIIINRRKRSKSQPYFEIIDNNKIYEINKNQKYQIQIPYLGGEINKSPDNPISQNQNSNLNLPQNQMPIEHLVSTSFQIPAQYLNLQQNHPQYKTQNNYYPSNRNLQNQSQNLFQNLNNINYPQQSQPSQPPQADLSPYLTQRQYYDYRQRLHRIPSDLGSNTNISISPSNYPSSYQIPFNNNLINSSPNPVNFNNNSQNANELFNMNINNQNNYFGKIMEIFFHEQEKIIESYKETIEKLKSERDEAIYKNKANEEKIKVLQKMQKDQEILQKNLGYFPFNNNYNQNMEKTLNSIMHKNDDYKEYNEKNIISINDKKRSHQSINNINNNSNISDSKLASFITSTKFVKVNLNGDNKQLLETWRKEDKLETEKDENIQDKGEEFKSKFKLNGMDTNDFMEKINLINNKFLEPHEEPENFQNDNTISIISKTQKNDKSFANEISNRNDKIEISNINHNNINNDKEDINNNIRDSDLSTKNFVTELQSKDFILNNVHNPVMQNLDNNISYSTQIKERLKEKKNLFDKEKDKHNKVDIISEVQRSSLSHNEEEEKKEKFQNYAFKQISCSGSKKIDNIENYNNNNFYDGIQKIKLLPGLKNIDNNITILQSKNNYSLFISKHINKNDNEINPFENIVSINNEEENLNMNNNIKNKNIIEEEINDLPNLDSPKNWKKEEINEIEEENNKNNYEIIYNNEKENINNSKQINNTSKEEEIIDRLNFFEEDNDNILTEKIKLDKKESKNKFNNINIDINDSFLKENRNLLNKNDNNNFNRNNINEISKHTNRPPSDLTGDKITSLNNLYDQFVKKKKDQLNETNNSIMNNNYNNNNITNNSLLNESLNTFTQNLNKKWKDLSKKDISNLKTNREEHYNEENIYENNYSYLDDDKLEDEKIFGKVNQFTKVALNELKQSQLSVFSKEKTIKKYD